MSIYVKRIGKTVTIEVAAERLGWSFVKNDQGAWGVNAGRVWLRVW